MVSIFLDLSLNYETFCEDLKKPLDASITKAFHRGELSHSQKQAVIKLIEKKDRDKKFIKNWRPISLLNIDTKLISKVLAERLKNVLSSLTSSDQDFTLKHLSLFEICAREVCEKFVYKHSETIEYVKN